MIKDFIHWLLEPSFPKAIALMVTVAASVLSDVRIREALFTPIIVRVRGGRRGKRAVALDCGGFQAEGYARDEHAPALLDTVTG